MDTDFLYLALAHDNWYDYIRPSKKAEGEALREHDCDDSFKADAVQNFFPRTFCDKQKSTTSVNQVCSRKNLDVLK